MHNEIPHAGSHGRGSSFVRGQDTGGAWKLLAAKTAAGIRRRVLAHTIAHNGGYLSQACSSAEIFAVLYTRVLKLKKLDRPLLPPPFTGVPGPDHPARTGADFNGGGDPALDSFILSPAQYALVLYAALVETGRMDEAGMESYNKDGSTVEVIGAEHSPGMEVTSGALGQGISQAAGIALARRIRGEPGRVLMFMSDGECESGEFWEALQAACYHKLGNMLVYVDVNGFQCDGKRSDVMEIEPFHRRIEAFGARVFRLNGHDIDELARLGEIPPAETPTFILCDTDPCRNMEILRERYPRFHYVRFLKAGEKDRYQAYLDELNEAAEKTGARAAAAVKKDAGGTAKDEANGGAMEILTRVHARPLVEWAASRPDIYVLSADLTSSCEADGFRDAYPDRFLSMGIAEQNMLSFAGG
ncbi:MAG: hypothetical protein LBN92_06490, partial [Treponema sp.]|nr:hypothetical protein [Treponema sp.]